MESTKDKIEKNLTFIRHAQSTHNAALKNYPNLDEKDFVNTKLSEEGITQASKISGECELLILSPMKRTLETYIHSKLKVKRLVTSDLFREWTGCGTPSMFELEDHSKKETENDLQNRVTKALEFIKQQPEKNIVILSHCVFLRFMCAKIGRGREDFHNAQVVQEKDVLF